MKKKRLTDEEHKLEALRRNRLKHLLGLLLHIEVSWEHGFNGGGHAWGASYAAVTIEGRRLGMTKILLKKLVSARVAFFEKRLMEREFKRAGKSFFEDGDRASTELGLEIINALPEEASYTDGLICMTYINHALLHDLAILENDNTHEMEKLEKAYAAFANWLLPQESPLVSIMSEVYWRVRDKFLCNPDWTCGGTLEWVESEQEKYESGLVAGLAIGLFGFKAGGGRA